MSPSRAQAADAAADAADHGVQPMDYVLRLPGHNGSVRVQTSDSSRFVEMIVDDGGNRGSVLLLPAEARQIAAVLQAAAGEA